ncbi:MAG TPA: hypothetical protein VKL19_09390 [Thermoanaerobaculia bacterium]|nr:hypothetical protein [Thermoanaerobaculia bacterium]
MAVTVKNVVIWRAEVAHLRGELARVLQPLAEAAANLQVIMAYAEGERGLVEICPISGKKVTDAAKKAGFSPSSKPTLLVQGDDRAGLGSRIAKAIAEQGVSISFDVTQVIGRKFSSVYGFQAEDDARKAAAAIKKASR